MYRAFKALQNENPPGDLSKPQLDGDSGKTKASHFYELVPFPANPFLNGCRGIIRMGGENISDFLEYVAKNIYYTYGGLYKLKPTHGVYTYRRQPTGAPIGEITAPLKRDPESGEIIKITPEEATRLFYKRIAHVEKMVSQDTQRL
ncbi:hypothetical protein DRQ05_06515 [bacterium]|nr:MAG: hypothetical protein DRQ05_06515 [bacterium]